MALDKRYGLAVDSEQLERWREASRTDPRLEILSEGAKLAAWVRLTLDEAARGRGESSP